MKGYKKKDYNGMTNVSSYAINCRIHGYYYRYSSYYKRLDKKGFFNMNMQYSHWYDYYNNFTYFL